MPRSAEGTPEGTLGREHRWSYRLEHANLGANFREDLQAQLTATALDVLRPVHHPSSFSRLQRFRPYTGRTIAPHRKTDGSDTAPTIFKWKVRKPVDRQEARSDRHLRSGLVFGHEALGIVDDGARPDVLNVTHDIDLADIRRLIAQTPSNGHSTEICKGLWEVGCAWHRQLEPTDSVVAKIALQQRADGRQNVLMQAIRCPPSCEKDRDIIPRLPSPSVWVPMSLRLPNDRMECAFALPLTTGSSS